MDGGNLAPIHQNKWDTRSYPQYYRIKLIIYEPINETKQRVTEKQQSLIEINLVL